MDYRMVSQPSQSSQPTFYVGRKARKRLADLAAYAILAIVGFTMILPFVWMVGTSLKTHKELFTWPPTFFPAEAQWSNYPDAWNYSEQVMFGRFFFNSAFVALSATVGQLITCTTAGYAFARLRFPGRDKLFLLYIGTLMVPYQVTLVPLYIIMQRLGWVNTYQGLIVPALVSAYGTFLVRQFMLSIPKELEEAATIDGASIPVIFVRVILPLSKPVIATLAILSFMGSWNAFVWPLIMISSAKLRTLPIGLAFFTSIPETIGFPRYELFMAAATFSMLPTLLVFLFFQRYFIKGIATTGLKG